MILAVFTGCQKTISVSPGARVLAAVNDEAITVGEFQKEMGQDSQTSEDPEVLKTLKHDLLQQLIDRKLFLQEAKHLKLSVSDEELAQASNQIQGDYTPEEFRELVDSKQLGDAVWKTGLKEKLLIEKLQNQATSNPKIDITMEEAKQYYDANRAHFIIKESVHVHQIVVAKEADAKAIRLELLNGADFATLASSKSLGPEKNQGGDLGFMTRDNLPEEFDLIFSIGIGKISPVVKSPYGYHIFKVEERRSAHQETFVESIEKIQAVLLQIKQEQRFADWIADLRHRSDIKINEQLLNEVSG
ncbi:MAG TPA: peptidyl-prolyl cis-trans isomerase [Nitrospiria bacterium]|jgi:parvulin-like peptidyl-prolyl isomerase|nr:peptidyl-prolyl cis-trans isomerase [Nitrospiria bacterium]